MNIHDATEQAYKNGYANGKKDAVKWIPVRCKDCRYFTEGMAIGMCKRIPGKEIMPMRYDDFCSYGERRTE